jgi:hypothetical protein
MKAWLTEKLADSKAEIKATPSLAWVRSDVDDVEGSARALWKEFASAKYVNAKNKC